MSNALIIGAGPAGLTAAYELANLGMRATVLEADDQVGGLSRTVNYRGYRFDIGGHRFFSKVELVNEIWHRILGDDLLIRPRLSRIHYREKFFDYPLRPLNALAGLGPLETALVGMSYAKAHLFPIRDEKSFEDWVTNRFGARLYSIFFKTYTEKVWGTPCSEISSDWAAQRIKNLSLAEAVRNALLQSINSKGGEVISTLIDRFYYPRFGPGMMWERCAAMVAEEGTDTHCGMRVERIRHRNGRVEAVCVRTAGGESVELPAPHVISTMPIRELIEALDPVPPVEVRRAAASLHYRDYLTVVLIVNRAAVFPDNWIYVHSPEVKLGRIQNYKNWSPDMVPDVSKTALGLEYFLWERDDEWSWSTERLIETGIRECARIGLVDPGEVEDGTVVRMTKAYPVYDQGYRENLDTVRAYLATFENLQTVGRNAQHRYNNQDHSMLAGIYAARNLTGERHDVWAINTETEYLEGGAALPPPGDRAAPSRAQRTPARPPLLPPDVVDIMFARLDPVALGAAFGAVAGLGLFLATAVLLLKGGPVVGPTLSLLGQYLIGFNVSWKGAFVGLAEAGAGGFVLGYSSATLRNWTLTAYAIVLRRRALAEARRDLLGRM